MAGLESCCWTSSTGSQFDLGEPTRPVDPTTLPAVQRGLELIAELPPALAEYGLDSPYDPQYDNHCHSPIGDLNCPCFHPGGHGACTCPRLSHASGPRTDNLVNFVDNRKGQESILRIIDNKFEDLTRIEAHPPSSCPAVGRKEALVREIAHHERLLYDFQTAAIRFGALGRDRMSRGASPLCDQCTTDIEGEPLPLSLPPSERNPKFKSRLGSCEPPCYRQCSDCHPAGPRTRGPDIFRRISTVLSQVAAVCSGQHRQQQPGEGKSGGGGCTGSLSGEQLWVGAVGLNLRLIVRMAAQEGDDRDVGGKGTTAGDNDETDGHDGVNSSGFELARLADGVEALPAIFADAQACHARALHGLVRLRGLTLPRDGRRELRAVEAEMRGIGRMLEGLDSGMREVERQLARWDGEQQQQQQQQQQDIKDEACNMNCITPATISDDDGERHHRYMEEKAASLEESIGARVCALNALALRWRQGAQAASCAVDRLGRGLLPSSGAPIAFYDSLHQGEWGGVGGFVGGGGAGDGGYRPLWPSSSSSSSVMPLPGMAGDTGINRKRHRGEDNDDNCPERSEAAAGAAMKGVVAASLPPATATAAGTVDTSSMSGSRSPTPLLSIATPTTDSPPPPLAPAACESMGDLQHGLSGILVDDDGDDDGAATAKSSAELTCNSSSDDSIKAHDNDDDDDDDIV